MLLTLSWSQLLTRLDVVVAVVAIAAAFKSAYNGTVKNLVDNIVRIEPLEEKVDTIEDRQSEMIDGIVAVSIAEGDNEYTVDTEQLAEDLRGGSYRAFLKRNGTAKNPYSHVEDEEEVCEEEPRWRQDYDDD